MICQEAVPPISPLNRSHFLYARADQAAWFRAFGPTPGAGSIAPPHASLLRAEVFRFEPLALPQLSARQSRQRCSPQFRASPLLASVPHQAVAVVSAPIRKAVTATGRGLLATGRC